MRARGQNNTVSHTFGPKHKAQSVLYNDELWEIYLNGYEWGAIGHGAPNSGDINFTEGLLASVDSTTQLTFKKAVMNTNYNEKTNSFTIDINGEFSNGQKFSLYKEFKTVIASYAFNTSDNYYDYSPSDSVSYHALFKPFTGNMFKLVAPSPSKADKEAAYNQARAIFKELVESIDQEKKTVLLLGNGW